MRAAFFDLDKTVISKTSVVAFGPSFRKEGLVRRRTVIKALVQQLLFLQFGADEERLEKIRIAMLRLTKGWSQETVAKIVKEALVDVIEPLVYKEAAEKIAFHIEAGDLVYLVSASPQEVVGPLAELLGVTGALASRGAVDAEGNYTGEMEFYCYGKHKATAIKELSETHGIDLVESFAYSDSATDIPMLEIVGNPVAVNPDRALARKAYEAGWEILAFTKPVPLKKKYAPSKPLAVALLTTTAAAVGIVATALVVRAKRAA